MPLSRCLAIALVVLPFAAFGQSKQNDAPSATQQVASATVPAEPWRILPKDVTKASSSSLVRQAQGQDSEKLSAGRDQGIVLEDVPRTPPDVNIVVLPGATFPLSPGGINADTYCLKIRSYVVARDSRDSDSTHLVSYSTCQPASRYRLKTIELQAQPAIR